MRKKRSPRCRSASQGDSSFVGSCSHWKRRAQSQSHLRKSHFEGICSSRRLPTQSFGETRGWPHWPKSCTPWRPRHQFRWQNLGCRRESSKMYSHWRRLLGWLSENLAKLPASKTYSQQRPPNRSDEPNSAWSPTPASCILGRHCVQFDRSLQEYTQPPTLLLPVQRTPC